jgi:hypothetical protein
MKVVVSKSSGKATAIIKAKYFSKREFSRRAKEEAYVGLTTKFLIQEEAFVERYPSMPLIMFIDMDADFLPPKHAIRRLVTTGWDVTFSIEQLNLLLERLSR